MKKLIFIALSGILLGAFNANAQGLKIGYTDIDYILGAMPEAKQIESELNEYSKQLEAQLKSKMDEFQSKAADYQKNQGTWLPEIKSDKEQELQSMQQSIQKFQQDAESSLQKKQVQLLQPVYDKIQGAIDKVREENGFTLILSARPSGVSVILSADETLDVSNLVFAKLGVQPPADKSNE
jgi:outer membrane protein